MSVNSFGSIYKKDKDDLLDKCYETYLDIAKKYKLKKIAFPCISTGLYGFPIIDAKNRAIKSVYRWLNKNKYNIQIIFCTYLDKDYEAYLNK